MNFYLGVGLIVVAIVMLWIAQPRNGKMAPFLKARYVEEAYVVGIVASLGMGIATLFGGLVGG